jgi:hypothetical protein
MQVFIGTLFGQCTTNAIMGAPFADCAARNDHSRQRGIGLGDPRRQRAAQAVSQHEDLLSVDSRVSRSPGVRIAMRSITLRSSRAFPGHP